MILRRCDRDIYWFAGPDVVLTPDSVYRCAVGAVQATRSSKSFTVQVPGLDYHGHMDEASQGMVEEFEKLRGYLLESEGDVEEAKA